VELGRVRWAANRSIRTVELSTAAHGACILAPRYAQSTKGGHLRMERFPSAPGPEPVPSLRLVRPEELELADGADAPDDRGEVSLNIRLRAFFTRFYKPIVIDGPGLSAGTLAGYLELLGWWERLTSNPPLRLIDQFLVSAFAKRLREATYKRGPLGVERRLSPCRVSLLLRNLRSILYRIGPQRDHRPAAELPFRPPAVPVDNPELEPKEAFSLERARAIVAAGRLIDRPRLEGIPTPDFWRALLAWYYVTGLRRGGLLGVEWTMLADRRDHWLLTVPARLVEKTGKGKRIAIPLWACAPVAGWPRGRPQIFAFPYSVDHLNDLHYELQTLAGVPEAEQLPIQGWRRTHANAMGEAGLHLAERLAQAALDHADSRTTRASYADFENRVRLRLPPLWDLSERPDDRQRLLF
jgi:integrase